MRSTKLANILALVAVFTVFLLFALIDASPLPESTSIATGGPNNVARKTKVCICTCETKSCKSHCCAASQEKSFLGALALRTFYGVEPDQTVRRGETTKDASTALALGAVKNAANVASPPIAKKTIDAAQTAARHDAPANYGLIEGKTAEHNSLTGEVANKHALRACCPCNAIGLFCSYNCCAGNKGALAAFGDGSSVMTSRALAGPGAENQHELYSKRALPQGEEEHQVKARAQTHNHHAVLAPRADDEAH